MGPILLYGHAHDMFELESIDRRIDALGIDLKLYAAGPAKLVHFYFFRTGIGCVDLDSS